MVAFVIRSQWPGFHLRICQRDNLSEALSSLGVCDNETIMLGTCTDSLYRMVQEDNQVISLEMAEYTKG